MKGIGKKIGILGGTFDPIHCGHMIIARSAMEQYGLDEVRFMTGGNPPHKSGNEITPALMRHGMVKRAVEDEPLFFADDHEVLKETYSYTAETLEELRGKYGDAEIYFIIGEDSLADLPDWYRPDRILENCILLVYPRGHADELDRLIAERKKVLGGDIRKIDAPVFGVSSTQIRERAEAGLSLKYLVPDNVIKYIRENKLYTENIYTDKKERDGGMAADSRQTDIKEMKKKLAIALKKKRYKHSIGVSREALRMARLFGADEEKAYIAGLLHDCAKCCEKDEQFEICKKYGIEVDKYTHLCPAVLHAPAGAALAEHEYGIDDPEILSAIRYHTTACADMSLLDKIIYVADMTEPGRDYDGADELRALAAKDIDEAYTEALRQTLMFNIQKYAAVHPDTLAAWNAVMAGKKGM